MRYLPIDKDKIPYRFDARLAGETFKFEIKYNSDNDYYTVDLYRKKELLVAGEKIVYGMPLFAEITDDSLPDVYIFPFDEKDKVDEVNKSTLMEDVFLYVFDKDEIDEILR